MKILVITKNSFVKIQNLVVNHISQLVKSNPGQIQEKQSTDVNRRNVTDIMYHIGTSEKKLFYYLSFKEISIIKHSAYHLLTI